MWPASALASRPFGVGVFAAQCFSYFPECSHQVHDEPGALGLGQLRISHASELATHHEVGSVRRDCVGEGGRGDAMWLKDSLGPGIKKPALGGLVVVGI